MFRAMFRSTQLHVRTRSGRTWLRVAFEYESEENDIYIYTCFVEFGTLNSAFLFHHVPRSTALTTESIM
jgi:hypothetical protein